MDGKWPVGREGTGVSGSRNSQNEDLEQPGSWCIGGCMLSGVARVVPAFSSGSLIQNLAHRCLVKESQGFKYV